MDRVKQNDRSPDTTTLYAWLSRDQDGIEGIVAAPISGKIMALVSADEERAMALRPVAAFAADARGFPAHLVRFTRADTIMTVGGVS